MTFAATRRALLAATALLSLGTGLATAQEQITLRYLTANDPTNVAVAEGYKAAFEAANPGVTIQIETVPDNDPNYVRTAIASGTAPDIVRYNSGAGLAALNPAQTLVPMTGEPFMDNVMDSFLLTVSDGQGNVYGPPDEASMGGGILYNKKIYEELGLTIPKTWDEFMANNEKIKAAGKIPVIQTFGSTWTSQIFVLADYYNVQAAVPNFAEEYTAGNMKYASTPAALAGFQHGEDVFKAGYLNEDFGVAIFEDGLRMVAEGEGAHYPMLTFAVGAIAQNHPDFLNDVGFFSMPGSDAAKNGLTVWMPQGVFIPKTTVHVDVAKKFLALIASPEGCDIRTAANGATGPYLIKGCTLPEDVPPAVADMESYFVSETSTAPALEYVSPIKGPALEQLTVEVGSGIRSAADAAALYDEDVKKQAQQLGLPGWD